MQMLSLPTMAQVILPSFQINADECGKIKQLQFGDSPSLSLWLASTILSLSHMHDQCMNHAGLQNMMRSAASQKFSDAEILFYQYWIDLW